MAVTALSLPSRRVSGSRWSPEMVWGTIFVIPYVMVFLVLVVWPVAYGVWLGSSPASFRTLFSDPIYLKTVWNTVIFLGVGINLKMFLALLLSGYFASVRPWVRWLSVIFILPWAVPSIPTIFSFRWMLNSEWGMFNNLLWSLFGIEGPWWLVKPDLAFGSVIFVHIWKYLPFWTLILLAGRMAIPTDLYEAARIDGASPLQQFWYVTWPQIREPLRHEPAALDHLEPRRLQQRLSAHRRRPGGQDPRAGHARAYATPSTCSSSAPAWRR